MNRNLIIASGCGAMVILGVGGILFGAGAMMWLTGRSDGVVASEPVVAPTPPTKTAGNPVPPPPLPAGMVAAAGNTPLPQAALTGDRCDELQTGGPVRDSCVSGDIKCGDVLIGHTRGGVKRFDTKFYERNRCSPGTRNWDGGDERVYRLQMPPGESHAVVTLDTPCADLTLAALEWSGSACPTDKDMLSRCELNREDGTRREFVELVNQGGGAWLIVVEGVKEEEGSFALSVNCYKGVHGYEPL